MSFHWPHRRTIAITNIRVRLYSYDFAVTYQKSINKRHWFEYHFQSRSARNADSIVTGNRLRPFRSPPQTRPRHIGPPPPPPRSCPEFRGQRGSLRQQRGHVGPLRHRGSIVNV